MNAKPHARAALAVYSIGQKLRALRTEKGLTLSRLSAETKLSTALISKLETELMVPTLPTLARMARIYGVDLSYFFSGPTQHSLAITRHAHVVDPRRNYESATERPLHRATPTSRLVSKILEIPEGVSWSIGSPGSKTELSAYVLEGTLHLASAGSDDVLHPGDYLVFETDTTSVWTAHEARCRVLVTFARTPHE